MKYKLKILITLVILAQFIAYPVILAESENEIESYYKPVDYFYNSLGHFNITHYNFLTFLSSESINNLIDVNYTSPESTDYYFSRTQNDKILMNFTLYVNHSLNSGRGWLPFIKRFTGFDIYISNISVWPHIDYFYIPNITECESPTREPYTIQIESKNQLNDLYIDEGKDVTLAVLIYPFYKITALSPPFFAKKPIQLDIKIYANES